MAEKENYQQLELFSDSGEPGLRDREAKSSFLRHLWNYEKTILLVIALVSCGIISFSLGVERGKKMTLAASAGMSPASAAGEKASPKQRPVQQAGDAEEKQNTQANDYFQGFTIQLASYRSRGFAEKEAQSLKRKGLSPLVLNKGNYIVLCVGNFSDKAQAQSLLPQLKKRYADCRIRRL